ncbi:latherin-like [Diceros bicornis minor]|uniref:latherin-like n=1 Tax=Diceros bicornis minor TaxID=77932 RepID=UPI0026EB1C57|nr:latherin-like [Diceros bicornis minor]
MLKVSGLFILLCGLFVPSSQTIPVDASQITDALTQELIDKKFLSLLGAINLDGLLNTILSKVTGLLNLLTGSLLGNNVAIIRLQDPRLLQLSLHFTPGSKEVELWIPFSSSLYVKLSLLDPLILNLQINIRVQLLLESGIDGKYRLVVGHCRLLPETIQLQSGTLVLILTLAYFLVFQLCPFLNSLLSNLDLQLVNDLINLILQNASLQVGV